MGNFRLQLGGVIAPYLQRKGQTQGRERGRREKTEGKKEIGKKGGIGGIG